MRIQEQIPAKCGGDGGLSQNAPFKAHDLIAYPVDKRKKYLWDDNNVKAYEIQTTARKDKVLLNKEKESKYGMPITWVTYDKGIMDNIKELTANKDEYMLVNIRDIQ